MIEDILGKIIYVFETNLNGSHKSESAKHAESFYGAVLGVGRGRTGDSYAIPTRSFDLKPLPLNELEIYIQDFIYYARLNTNLTFEIVKFTSHKEDYLKQLFLDVPDNCILPTGW